MPHLPTSHAWPTAILLLTLQGCAAPPAPAESAPPGSVVLVDPSEARTHLTASPEPAYPMLAQAAGIGGAVYYEVDISPDGRVAAARLLHGSPILEQSADEAVRDWRYAPFRVDGQLVTARTVAILMFTGRPVPAATLAAIDRFADALLVCSDSSQRSAFDEAETHCSAAMGIAAAELTSFDRTSDVRPRRLYGEALAAQDRHDEAVASFEAVVARLRDLPVYAVDRTLALMALGRSLTAIDRGVDAMDAYRRADRQLTDALRSAPRDSPFRAEVTGSLRTLLDDYASLLESEGRTADAQPLRARLAALP